MSRYYPARSRADVRADLVARKGAAPVMDCRSERYDNPNSSGALYGITSARYDALAIRSPEAARKRKARDRAWVERSFRTTGNFAVESRKGGR